MTRRQQFKQYQTPFSEWQRDNKNIESGAHGVNVNDIDDTRFDSQWIIHNWKHVSEERFMFVEQKSRCGKLTESQEDLFDLINLLAIAVGFLKYPIRDRKGRDRTAVFYGYHLLVHEGATPQDGRIWWNGQQISLTELERIYRFEIDPRTVGEWPYQRQKQAVNSTPDQLRKKAIEWAK